MDGNNVIEKISDFKLHEQFLLLASRYTITEEEREYMYNLASDYHMDWYHFLGLALINRVNGVVYRNIKDIKPVPTYVKYFLKVVYEEQYERTRIHQEELIKIATMFEKENISHAFLKGAIFNTIFYNPGDRISNDTDIMVSISDIDRASKILKDMGYIQGEVIDGAIKPASKKEIVFARLNTYEIVSFNKELDPKHLPFHTVDINFRFGNDDDGSGVDEVLRESELYEKNDHKIRSLSLEGFLFFLCVHHYREAVMIYKIAHDKDLTLYKFMDVHFFLKQRGDKIDWNKLKKIAEENHRLPDVYYTLYYSEVLYPGTVSEEILELLKPDDVSYLNQYKGRDNSDEVYEWKEDFIHRVFTHERRIEAMSNIEEEDKRYTSIMEKLRS